MINITEEAKEKLIFTLNEENAEVIRFGLKGGGCNGFTYYLQIENQPPEEDDLQININDKYIVLIDPMSMMYLDDIEIGYKKDFMGESFIFTNPNSIGQCGCGSSVNF